jgi:pimeloyl-ACP methyl ester carboxylesterase
VLFSGGLLVTLVAPTLRPRLDSLILLDSAPLIAGEKAREDIEHATAIFSFLPGLSLITTAVARLGVFRLLYALGLAHSDLIDERDALPAQLHAAFLNEFSSPRTYANLGIESRHLFAAWSGAATLLASTSAAVPLLGDTPLLIVRASVAEFPNEEQRAHWLALIAADAAQMLLSRRVTRVAFDKANHFFRGQFAQPFVAALVEFIDRRKLQ